MKEIGKLFITIGASISAFCIYWAFRGISTVQEYLVISTAIIVVAILEVSGIILFNLFKK